ncbi:MAG: hypothetical protein IJ770_04780 [Alphaproteobacteria bacterium]|nr:hypothetical protein [Alphaproteobacteria bacterium]
MEEVRIICTPFLIAAIVFTLAMLYYEMQFKKKNPWWSQDDCRMRLSPAERAYRQNERRKHNNALMCWFAVLFVVLGLMIVVLLSHINGGFPNIGHYWLYLVPFVGAVVFACSCIQRRK